MSTATLTECGICHETREPASWAFQAPQEDDDVSEYAVCASCVVPQLDTDGFTMVAVTVAFTVPADFGSFNWPFFVAALIRSHFNSYPDGHGPAETVQVIDSWRADK